MSEGKTVVYLVRHGESEGNRRDAFVGHTDVNLTDIGRAQAEKDEKKARSCRYR